MEQQDLEGEGEEDVRRLPDDADLARLLHLEGDRQHELAYEGQQSYQDHHGSVVTTLRNTAVTKSHHQEETLQSSDTSEDHQRDGEVNVFEFPEDDVDIRLEENGPDEVYNSCDIILVIQDIAGVVAKYEGRSGSTLYSSHFKPPRSSSDLIMKSIPRRVTNTLITSNTLRGSFKKILAKMTTQMGEPAEIMLTSAMGMCLRP